MSDKLLRGFGDILSPFQDDVSASKVLWGKVEVLLDTSDKYFFQYL
jgi:hypothetical protein